MKDSFGARKTLECGGKTYSIASLPALAGHGVNLDRLPYSLRILLENLLRHEDGGSVTKEDILGLANWNPTDKARTEIAYRPARVLLQDFTGVPAVVDLAAMRDAMAALGKNPGSINPLQPVELVIDHSIQVDAFGTDSALATNSRLEFERNAERYAFLRWGQSGFANFKAVPPETGICHQVNLEFLARVAMTDEVGGTDWVYPDTLVGTDSHTTMINGLGVLGWGVGGIEAEAAMLGQPVAMLVPDVVGMKLVGKLPEGTTATDMVLRVTQELRAHGVVGKFVEFFGSGIAEMSLADRATIANMAPEYGATCGLFPVDAETLEYLRFTGRREEAERAEAYYRAQGMFHDENTQEAEYSARLELDLSTIQPAMAGPKRPQDRVLLADMPKTMTEAIAAAPKSAKRKGPVKTEINGEAVEIGDSSVVIAAITSCTNTSNPSVMLAAGLVAKKARQLGIKPKPWVKTSLAPGSKVVTEYLQRSGLLKDLENIGYDVVGYGCTTCIGNSGPLPEPVAKAIDQGDLVVSSVLSGNRNFEGRVHAAIRANFLASPPLVVAYSLAGRTDFDPHTEPLTQTADGKDVFLKDVWPSQDEVRAAVRENVTPDQFERIYADVYTGPESWQAIQIPEGDTYAWEPSSTYVRNPPYFEGLTLDPAPLQDVEGARVLALLGDSVTTDHISPAGAIATTSPAGLYLKEHGVDPVDFNSYGARRGNHEVMMRGTFANVRIKNQLVPGVEGGFTKVLPEAGEVVAIYDAAMAYRARKTPTIVLAGKEYGTGSSRDWAAKGPKLLGVSAVIAQSYERIHRSNLIGMGILPLQFLEGESAESLGLTGLESYTIRGLAKHFGEGFGGGGNLEVEVKADDGSTKTIRTLVRVDTPQEGGYLTDGGILHYVLRGLARNS